MIRETRDALPLLNVKTEANGDLWSTNDGGSSLVVRLACHAGTRNFYPALAALFSPVQNIFFLTVHYFSLCVPNAQQPGQPVVQGRLSLNVCLRL